MRFFPIVFLTLSSLACASESGVIPLKVSPKFKANNCQTILSAKVSDEKVIDNFRMDNETAFLPMSLYGKKSVECYTFNYFPEVSPYIDLKVKNKYLNMVEMSGTASNGYWVSLKYKIDTKRKTLIKIEK